MFKKTKRDIKKKQIGFVDEHKEMKIVRLKVL